MTAERHIDYEALAQGAMRGIVRTVLERVAKSGLPGEHHFYIAFNTEAPGVVISKRLKQKYPEEMTVVLQHRFWDLTVTEERFEVKLTFDGIPERLSVPFAAVKVFFDPSVPYGLQFEESEATDASARDGAALRPGEGAEAEAANKGPVRPALRTAEKKPRAVRKPRLEKPADDQGEASEPKAPAKPSAANADTSAASSEPKVVSLDKFRKK
jgi:hypothetical protein